MRSGDEQQGGHRRLENRPRVSFAGPDRLFTQGEAVRSLMKSSKMDGDILVVMFGGDDSCRASWLDGSLTSTEHQRTSEIS